MRLLFKFDKKSFHTHTILCNKSMNMFEAIKLNLKRKSRVLFGVYVGMLVCFAARQRKIIKPKKYFIESIALPKR